MRVGLLADFHVGNEAGLALLPANGIQKKLKDLYEATIAKVLAEGPLDLLVAVGDIVDGAQEKSGGIDVTLRRNEQARQAAELLKLWNAKEMFLLEGTSYHTGLTRVEESVKDLLVAAGIQTSFHRKLNLLLNGWFKLQARHFIGSSSIPHARPSAPSRAKMWGVLNAAMKGETPPDLSVYAHVHYYQCLEDAFGVVMTLPCWQGIGSAYGDLKCDGHMDVGMVILDIGATREAGWSHQRILYPASHASRTVQRSDGKS